jgi:hypothetical protein
VHFYKKNGNNIRCETCRHFKKKEEYLRDEINEHKANSKDRSMTDIQHKIKQQTLESQNTTVLYYSGVLTFRRLLFNFVI